MTRRPSAASAQTLTTRELASRLSDYRRILTMLDGFTSRDARELRTLIADVVADLEQECRTR